MKQCPRCKRKYDETLRYCLDDGSVLSLAYDPEETLVMPHAQPVSPTATPPKSATQPFSSPRLLYVAIVVLAVFAAAATVALFYERDKAITPGSSGRQTESPSQSNASHPSNTLPTMSTSPVTAAPQNQERYAATACGSIQDSSTNLEWHVGPDRNMTWYQAQEWTAGLRACGGGWRMPAIEEIRTLYDPAMRAGTGYYTDGKYFPAHVDPVFRAIGGGSWVWADQQVGGGNARSFNLNQGKPVEYSAANTVYSTRAFAVRALRN